ncbi:MAG: sulfurtransferase TusA family protein [Blautia sp.]|nr:sulfurtransferase TusA family protein [Blautia sp.]
MVDARGLSCPIPVVMVQNEVKKSNPSRLEVMVDNQVAVENVSRFAASQGYKVQTSEEGDDFRLVLKK